MSVEERLRRSLTTRADQLLPVVETPLERVLRRYRRRHRFKVASTIAAAVVAVLVAGMGVDAVRTSVTRPGPAAPTSTATPFVDPAERLLGEYVVDAPRTSRGPADMAGRWTITLSVGGMTVVGPPAYAFPTSGGSWEAGASTLRTNIFLASPGCQRTATSSGVYRWTQIGDRLSFTIVEDACAPRRTLFAQPWRRVS